MNPKLYSFYQLTQVCKNQTHCLQVLTQNQFVWCILFLLDSKLQPNCHTAFKLINKLHLNLDGQPNQFSLWELIQLSKCNLNLDVAAETDCCSVKSCCSCFEMNQNQKKGCKTQNFSFPFKVDVSAVVIQLAYVLTNNSTQKII